MSQRLGLAGLEGTPAGISRHTANYSVTGPVPIPIASDPARGRNNTLELKFRQIHLYGLTNIYANSSSALR